MPVQINEMTTDVIAEPEQQLAGTGPQSDTDRWKELGVIRAVCSAIARLDWRTTTSRLLALAKPRAYA